MEDEDEEGEVPMDVQEEDEPNDGEQHPEDIAQPEQDEQMETDDSKEYSEKCQRRLQSNLHKYDMVRTKKWMRRIDQAEIGRIIAELEIKNVANLMSMADTDIGCFEET
jgi:ribonuclease HII